MGKLSELQNLNKIIKDGEIKLNTVKVNLKGIQNEIDIISNLESQLEENVKCLKKKRIVAIASEYKRSREELVKVKINLVNLKNTRERYRKIHIEIEQIIKKAKYEFDKLQKNGNDNVLRGKFGEKRMDKDEIQKRIVTEEDYIRCPKCNNSLNKFIAKNAEGIENNQIARLLMITEDKVEEVYQEAIKKLKEQMEESND